MTDSPFLMFLLALIAFCAVVTALSLLFTANSLWKTSRRLDLLLSHGDEAVREAHRAMGSVRQLLIKTNRAAAHVEGVVDQACGFAQNLFGQLQRVRKAVWGNHRTVSRVVNKRRIG